jgi:uncharacterized protein YecE (DUF72 family)
MQFFVGTSGYSYREWKGSFYPEKLRQREMLGYYAQRFAAVEINNTFYRLPANAVLKSWPQQVPKEFRFALKAPQAITHRKRLKSVRREMKDFLRAASILKGHQAPLLFQLPPNFRKDLPRLEAFLESIGTTTRAAFEFRHPSWFDGDVFNLLRKHSRSLCIADTDEAPNPGVVSTAGWGYVRLRRKRYSRRQLADWTQKLRSQKWTEAYVFFKHEQTGTGPRFATRFLELAGA